jgi:hypothetical protein
MLEYLIYVERRDGTESDVLSEPIASKQDVVRFERFKGVNNILRGLDAVMDASLMLALTRSRVLIRIDVVAQQKRPLCMDDSMCMGQADDDRLATKAGSQARGRNASEK